MANNRRLAKLRDRLRFEIGWRLLWAISTGIACTVRYKSRGEDEFKKLSSQTGVILALWHGATMLPIYYCRGRGYWSLISSSRDGALQDKLVQSRGYSTIRGSSGRGGVKAMLEAVRKLKEGVVLAWTPDGPKGPVKVVQAGVVLAAQKSGCPIVPVGVSCDRKKHVNSWDRHMIPMPFSHAAIVFGEPISVPDDNSVSVEDVCSRLADAINSADEQAARMLAEGKS